MTVQVRDVTRTFVAGATSVHALANVSLDVGPGCLLVIMGASGSGKTTLLNVIGGLDRPDTGDVCVNGRNLSEASESALATIRLTTIGFVFQEFNLMTDLTVVENVALPLEGMGVRRQEARARATEALGRVALGGMESRYPHELSGGQQQRVAIARAVVGGRQLLLADEPTGALDSETGADVMRLLRGLCDEGATAIVSTHNADNAVFADRVVQMRDGRIVGEVIQAAATATGARSR
jgi:putative ABC transport system ATP-binding protein